MEQPMRQEQRAEMVPRSQYWQELAGEEYAVKLHLQRLQGAPLHESLAFAVEASS
jgi:hypothetical protein